MIRNLYTGEMERGQCLGCRAHDDEPAAEGCKNPAWHVPSVSPPPEPEPQREVRLPYADD